MSAPLDSLIGQRLSHYHILEKLGEGGMGAVYCAEDSRLKRRVALKVMSEAGEEGSETRLRFQREARAIAALNHPNIVTIYSVEEAEGLVFISMELVEGSTLDRRIPDEGLPVAEVVELGYAVADALAAAHDLGIVHRDLKPTNVIVSRQGRVKVLDFGLAKVDAAHPGTSDSGDGTTHAMTQLKTRDGMVMGTVPYMSPEQLEGHKVGPASDIFSLGVVLYECLTGSNPFQRNNTAALMVAILQTDPEPVTKLRADAGDDLWAILERCLEKSPQRRYRSAADLRNDLEWLRQRDLSGTARKTPTSSGPRRLFQTCLCARTGTDGTLSPGQLRTELRRLLEELGGVEQILGGDESQRPVATFDVPTDAVRCALRLMRSLGSDDEPPPLAIGLHLGDVMLEEDSKISEPQSSTLDITRRLAAIAAPGQILMGQGCFDSARQEIREGPRGERVEWLAHGAYALDGLDLPIALYEIGVEGWSPLAAPKDGAGVRRATAPGDETTLGWRPAIGLTIPGRPEWELKERLGAGGFGDVWVAQHQRIGSLRAFKFCFDSVQLAALKREGALFRHLQSALGSRRDIARLLDWQVDEPPYYLESEYHGEGDLRQWAERQDDLNQVPLEQRLELIAQAADALAAAHGVGVLHKDIKPSNILVGSEDGEPRIWLADFGIGSLIQPDEAEAPTLGAGGLHDLGHSSGGTGLYMAPELLAGGRATIRSDIYSLGLVLFQIVVGDLHAMVGHGWERQIDDPELREDISACVDVLAENRLGSAEELAQRLRSREQRRARRLALATEAKRERVAVEARERQRKRSERQAFWAALVLAALSVGGGVFAWTQARRFSNVVDNSRSLVERQVLQTNLAAAHWVSEALHRELTNALLAVERSAADPGFRDAVLRRDYDGSQRFLDQRLDDLRATSLFSLALTDADGFSRARAPHSANVIGRNFAYRDYFHGGDAEQRPIRATYIAEPFVSKAKEGAAMIAVSTPVWSLGGGSDSEERPLGVLLGTLTLEHFADWVRNVPVAEELGDATQLGLDVVLLNERRQVVLHPNNPLFSDPDGGAVTWPSADLEEQLPRGAGKAAAALLLPDPLLDDPMLDEGVERPMAYPTGVARVEDYGWLVLVRILDLDSHPAQAILHQVAGVNRGFVRATIALAAVLLAVGVFLVLQVLRARGERG